MAFVGDSFVRRLRDDLVTRSFHAKSKPRDVSQTQPILASALSHTLRLDNEIRGVYTESNHLQFISDLPNAHLLLHHVRPDIVVVNVGSNDLANLAQVNRAAVLQLAVQLHSFAASFDARMVIMCKVLYRTQRLSGTPEIFAENADIFNSIVRNMCCKNSTPITLFNPLRGFMFEHNDTDTPIPRPVSSWSHDGIHVDTMASMTRFQERQRLFILDNLKLIKI